MKLTRRQFGLGVLLGAIAFFLGRLFGGCKSFDEPWIPGKEADARHWRLGDHLAG